MPYAIISDSGKQFRVEPGQSFFVDYRKVSRGETITFDSVLAVSTDDGLRVGKPLVEGATVTAKVLGPEFGDKLVVQKLRRRKNSRRKTGHRQVYTRVQIDSING